MWYLLWGGQVKMSLQLYQVDQKSFLLDFKSLNTVDHPDAKRVEIMTKAAMGKDGHLPAPVPQGSYCHFDARVLSAQPQ